MTDLPPPIPPHVIVRRAEAAVLRALEQHARRTAALAERQQDFRRVEERRLRDAAERRRREDVARLRNRQTTSQRY